MSFAVAELIKSYPKTIYYFYIASLADFQLKSVSFMVQN